ncbi:prepilin peptidase [Candidatus Latescibacterota bacterium]
MEINIEYIMFLGIVGFFGLSLGSFLNVIIYRMPRKESLVFPGSHCTVCSSPIRYRDNIPIVSFLMLHGRCRVCSAPISRIYPLIEFFTGCMAVFLFILHGPTLNFAADLVLGAILVAAALIDLKHMIIPNRLTYPGLVLGFLFSLRGGVTGIINGILGLAVGFLILTMMYLLGKLLYKRESLGMGDVKLAFVIGLFAGPFWTFICLVLAILSGGIFGVIQIASGKKKLAQEVPFGPYIALGGFCVLFFKRQIFFLVEQYLGIF